jgi:hypothetical protein
MHEVKVNLSGTLGGLTFAIQGTIELPAGLISLLVGNNSQQAAPHRTEEFSLTENTPTNAEGVDSAATTVGSQSAINEETEADMTNAVAAVASTLTEQTANDASDQGETNPPGSGDVDIDETTDFGESSGPAGDSLSAAGEQLPTQQDEDCDGAQNDFENVGGEPQSAVLRASDDEESDIDSDEVGEEGATDDNWLYSEAITNGASDLNVATGGEELETTEHEGVTPAATLDADMSGSDSDGNATNREDDTSEEPVEEGTNPGNRYAPTN